MLLTSIGSLQYYLPVSLGIDTYLSYKLSVFYFFFVEIRLSGFFDIPDDIVICNLIRVLLLGISRVRDI